jgi:hypothetical protein
MDQNIRRELASTLGIRLRDGGAEAEAWAIINADLKGLQARTHGLVERVSPFARNNSWWEIVTRTAGRLGVFYDDGMSVREVEARIFERMAELVVAALPKEEITELDRLSHESPGFYAALEALRLSRNGIRFVLTGLSHMAARARTETYTRAVMMAGWLNKKIHAFVLLPSVTRGLTVLEATCRALVVAWRNLAAMTSVGSRNSRKLATVLAAMYFQSLLVEDLEDFRFIKA